MSNKQKLAEMKRRKATLEAQIKTIKESKKSQPVSESRTGLAYLIESELEKAEVLLAAKSIVDKLQKMAEDLAKVNGDEIMPIMEPLKTAFGPQMADAFQKITSEKVNATVAAVTQAKDAISAEVAKFEGIMNGTGAGNDMASMGGDEMGMDAAAPAAPANDMAGDAGLGGDDMGGDEMEVSGEIDMGGADPVSDDGAFDSDPLAGSPAGRPKKESAAPRGRMVESKSDARIVKAFRRLLGEGMKPVPAARKIADRLAIDYADVVEVIRESSGLGK
ncbi:MAG: hypothetical protein EOP83_01205 [Verrucomicrobiaceae bacterium]|nr:MAG: hypothetical protein EOP83_01205 [Verrucomicrobiaceae bacterium]